MNFNPWQDYLNLREVFFCKDWKKNYRRTFSEIETSHLVQQQNESFTEDNIYFQNLKKELVKAVMNLTRSTEQKRKAEKIKQIPETKESIFKEKRTKNSEFYGEKKTQNVITFPKIESHFVAQERQAVGTESSIEDNMSSINSKEERLKVAVDTRSAEQDEAEKCQQILKTKESILKMIDTLKQKQEIKNVESDREEGKNQNLIVPCSFCRKNGERKIFYMTHSLKNSKGQVMCPILQKYVCPKCQATGLNAHTLLYCPQNNEYHSTSLTHLTPRMSSGKKRHF